jgi:hypothetical protein
MGVRDCHLQKDSLGRFHWKVERTDGKLLGCCFEASEANRYCDGFPNQESAQARLDSVVKQEIDKQ